MIETCHTDTTFADWLHEREKLHLFLTGETVIFRDIFEVPEELLVRTDIMPIFRPAGATNRIAVDRKKKLGIKVWEEVDVMRYKNSEGPQIPQLGFINRSPRPDKDTLGKKSKSPRQLIKVKLAKSTAWLNLYGWSDADNLHFKLTGEHLDFQETLTWFPDDVIPDGRVAIGHWHAARREVRFYWRRLDYCLPYIGARIVTYLTHNKPKSWFPPGFSRN